MSFRPDGTPPLAPELRAAIDRFAAYVAAQGPGAEEALRQQHNGDPRMAFLFGGEGHPYYRQRLGIEIENLRRIARMPTGPPAPIPLNEINVQPTAVPQRPQPDLELDPLEEKIHSLRQQIFESERNLQAHHDAMKDRKKHQVDKLFQMRENERILSLMNRVGMHYDPFIRLIEQLAISGSKEHIAKCKHWIFENCNTDQQREIVLSYLLQQCRTDESTGALRLHVLYLLNDWAYYCHRQRQENVRLLLSRFVPRMFAHATTCPSLADKLEKLVSVWEQNQFFDENCYQQLRSPSALAAEEAAMAEEKSKIGEEVEQELQQTYINFQQQHSTYEAHVLGQISALQEQVSKIKNAREERKRIGNRLAKEQFAPRHPYYETPAGMMVPLVAPESVTFEPIDPKKLRLPQPNATERLQKEIARFYAGLRDVKADLIDRDGWEVRGLAEFYAVKQHHKRKLLESLKADGKTFEQSITNRLHEPLECDRPPEAARRTRSRSRSSRSSTRSPSPSRERSSKWKEVKRSRSPSPDSRPSFGGLGGGGGGGPGFFKPSTSTEEEKPPFKVTLQPLKREENRGAQLLQKMGWQGGGLGTDGQGREEPVDGGAVRHPQDKFRGIGSNPDEFDEFRKRISHQRYGAPQ